MPSPQTSSPHASISQRYDVKETIGAGGFAKVKVGKHKLTGMPVAIKIMDKVGLGDDLPRAYREIETLKKLRHQHICQLYEVVETADRLYMVMEYAPGGELFDYIVAKDRLKEPEARKFFRQIASAVAYVHEKGFAHRDLKPENLLLDEKQNIKLIDFGLVANPSSLDDPLQTCCGSPAYAAPELIKGRPYLGTEADVWSMGILLYALLCGFLPFDHDNTAYLYRLIQAGKYDKPKWLSEGSLQLIDQMLVTNPTRRLTLTDLIQHSWMNTGGLGTVDWMSVYEEEVDMEVLQELSRGYGRSLQDIMQEVTQWKYDGVTATYFLLLKMKQAGRTMAMKSVGPIRRPMTPDRPRSPMVVRMRSNSMDMCSSMESLPGSDAEDMSSGLAPLTPPARGKFNFKIAIPPEPSVGQSVLLSPPTPVARFLQSEGVKTARSPSLDASLERGAITAPVTSGFLSGNDVFEDTQTAESAGKLSPGTMRARAPSIDTRLDQLSKSSKAAAATPERAGAGKAATLAREAAPSYATPTLPRRSSPSAKLSDSLTNIFGKLTTKKDPRKSKGLYTFETTSTKPASHVMSELVRVLQEKKISHKQKGYLVRCKVLDLKKKATIEFDIEICQLPQMDMIGIRRKRVKGDTFAFKNACEEILHAMHI